MQPKDIGENSWHPDFDATLLAPAGASGVVVLEARQPVPDHVWGSVLLLGNFDGLHVGHMELLTAARRHAALLKAPLGIMSCEPHPKQFFNPDATPFRLSGSNAKQLICARLGIDLLFMPRFDSEFANLSAEGFASELLAGQLGAKAVVVGEDFHFGKGRRGSVDDLRFFGLACEFDVIVVPDLIVRGERISSTLVRSWISSGDLDKANAALKGGWITKAFSDGCTKLIFEPATILPPAGQYFADIWNMKGDPLARVKIYLSLEPTATIEAPITIPAGAYLVSAWQKLNRDVARETHPEVVVGDPVRLAESRTSDALSN